MRTARTVQRRRWFAVLCALWVSVQLSGYAVFESTLEVVPADARAFFHVQNLRTLSDKVDDVAAALTGTETHDLAAQMLAKMVGAGFTSVDDLARDGFDIDNDFTFFWLTPTVEQFTALIHVKDEASVRRVLSREGFAPNAEYGGVPYASFGSGAIAFFDDLLVFSNVEGAMPRIIDAGNKEAPSILVAPRFRGLGLDPTRADVTAYVDVEALDDLFGALVPPQHQGEAPDTEENPFPPDVETLGMTLTFENGILRYHHEMRFREGSPLAVAVSAERNRPLKGIDTLPQTSVAVASGIFSAEEYQAYAREEDEKEASADPLDALLDKLTTALQDIPTDYEEEISVALRFHQSPLPDLVAVIPLAGHEAEAIMSAMLPVVLDAFSPGTAVETVERVPPRVAEWGTVEGWRFPTTLFQAGGNTPPPLVMLFPRELGLWYTVEGEDLIVGIAGTDASLLWAVEARRGGNTLTDDTNLASLREGLPSEGVWIGYLSPSRFLKAYGPILSLMVPQSQKLVEQIAAMDETFSLGAVVANRDAGNAVTIVARVADWGPVVAIFRDLGRPRGSGGPPGGMMH